MRGIIPTNVTAVDVVSQQLQLLGFAGSDAEDLSVEVLGGLILTGLGMLGILLKKCCGMCVKKATGEDTEDLLERGLLRSDDMTGTPPIRLLIVGATGDGKSTLINALRDPDLSHEAKAGLGTEGITKDIRLYHGKPINGRNIELLDSPGVGDEDITPIKLITLLEYALEGLKVDGVIVTNKVTEGRVTPAARIVKELVAHGFAGGTGEDEAAWQNIILVGTKSDQAPKELRQFFIEKVTKKFFPEGISGKFAITSVSPSGCCKKQRANLKALHEQICRLPSLSPVDYERPSSAVIAKAISNLVGTAETHASEVDNARKVLNDKLEEQKRQAEEEKKKLKEEMEMAELARQELEEEMEEAARIAEEERVAAQKAARVSAEETAAAEKRAEEAAEEARKAEAKALAAERAGAEEKAAAEKRV